MYFLARITGTLPTNDLGLVVGVWKDGDIHKFGVLDDISSSVESHHDTEGNERTEMTSTAMVVVPGI